MLFRVFFLVAWSVFNSSIGAEDNRPIEFPSFIREVVQRRDETCKCSDTVSLLNKLTDDVENMAGLMQEISGHTAQLAKGLQTHDYRLRIHDQNLKKLTAQAGGRQMRKISLHVDDNREFPSFIREVVRRRDEESCKCSDTMTLLNKLMDDVKRIIGSEHEIAGQTAQLQSHDDRLRLHDQSQKKLTAKVCPPGFEFLPEVNGCFRVIFQALSWTRAGEVCSKVMPGVHLAAVTSAVKQEAIAKYLQRQFTKKESTSYIIPENLWSGSKKSVWTSGQTRDPVRCDVNYAWKILEGVEILFKYTNWAIRQPDCSAHVGNVKENCVHMVANWNYAWNDLYCDWQFCPLCEV